MNEIRSFNKILDITSQVCNIEKEELKTKSRKHEYNIPRQIAAIVAIKDYEIKLNLVAKQLNRHRTAMYHYLKFHDSNYESWLPYRKKYDEVLQVLRNDPKETITHKYNFNSIIKKIKLRKCEIEEVYIEINCGKYKHIFLTDYFNFTQAMKTIRENFKNYNVKIKFGNYDG